MGKNIFALDKDIGSRAISNKSAYIGEGNTLELDETKQLYWKPIDVGNWSVIEDSNNSWSSGNPMFSFGIIQYDGEDMDLPFEKGDICYLSVQTYIDGKTITGYVKITEAISTKFSDTDETIEHGILKWEALTYFPPKRNIDPNTTTPYSISYSFTQVTPYYPFENLAFSYDSTGTKLTNLYYYQDEWGNKCYSVYDSRSNNGKYWPNYKANENTSGVLSAEDSLWTALRLEAEQHLPVDQDRMRKSYTEGTYSFNSGEGNIAFGNNVSTLGRFNIGIRNNSFAAGARNFIRGVDAVAIGLNNTVTGQCAIGFGYLNTVIGNRSFAFGKSNIINNRDSIILGFNNQANYAANFIMGHRCKTSHDYQIVLGQGNLPNTKGILVVGAGGYTDSEAAKDKNAIVVKNNGRVECPQGLTLYAPADANGNQKKFMIKVDSNGNLSTEQVWDS